MRGNKATVIAAVAAGGSARGEGGASITVGSYRNTHDATISINSSNGSTWSRTSASARTISTTIRTIITRRTTTAAAAAGRGGKNAGNRIDIRRKTGIGNGHFCS